jgi:DNA repair protein RadA/Sms
MAHQQIHQLSPPAAGPRSAAILRDACSASSDAVNRLLDVGQYHHEPLPLSDDLQWLKDLCGEVVQGGVYLLGGAPGGFKSGLALQLSLDLNRQGIRTLSILTEEPASRLKERALRMTGQWPREHVQTALSHLQVEADLRDIEDLPRFIASHVLSPAGRYHGVGMIVLDSIQGHGLSGAATRAYERLYEALRLTKSAGISTVLVSHVTKRGQIAGPRALEHNCDAVWLLRKTMAYRMLFVPKNRFGPCALKPLALELEPLTVTLRRAPHAQSMTSVARTFMGNGLGLAEVQASVGLSGLGARGKVMAPGLPRRDIEQLVSCLSGVPGIEIDDLDFVVHCRLPGSRPYNNVLGLPLCMALVSSYLQRPIPSHHLYLGEIDLLRSVRDLPPMLIEQLGRALAMGELPSPVKVLCPPSAVPSLPHDSGIEIVPCRRLDDAIFATWPELR